MGRFTDFVAGAGTMSNVTSVALGGGFALMLRSDATVHMLGTTSRLSLLGSINQIATSVIQVKLLGYIKVNSQYNIICIKTDQFQNSPQVAAGSSHLVLLRDDGSCWSMGSVSYMSNGYYGNPMGLGATSVASSPTLIMSIDAVLQVSAFICSYLVLYFSCESAT
jgi:alpha-tubulin suppressor-like RCC1 family protein